MTGKYLTEPGTMVDIIKDNVFVLEFLNRNREIDFKKEVWARDHGFQALLSDLQPFQGG